MRDDKPKPCKACDYENAQKRGRATWICPTCGRDISLEYVLWAEAMRDKQEGIMTKDEALEEFGECIDTIENLIAAMRMPVPQEIHIKALKEALPDLHRRLKQVYFEVGGDDVWSV